jgi:hypothetical protein
MGDHVSRHRFFCAEEEWERAKQERHQDHLLPTYHRKTASYQIEEVDQMVGGEAGLELEAGLYSPGGEGTIGYSSAFQTCTAERDENQASSSGRLGRRISPKLRSTKRQTYPCVYHISNCRVHDFFHYLCAVSWFAALSFCFPQALACSSALRRKQESLLARYCVWVAQPGSVKGAPLRSSRYAMWHT